MRKLTFALPLLALVGLGGCGVVGGGSGGSKTPVLGERVAVLGAEVDIGIDATTAAMPFNLPAARANANWEQSGGNATKSMGHLALGSNLAVAWTQSIGEGSSNTARLSTSPVVAEGRIFSIDTMGVIRAFDAASGALQWATNSASTSEDRGTLYGGGVAYGAGRLFATNGQGDVVSLDPSSGGIYWTVRPGGPLRGSPTFDGTNLYVTSQDNQIYALSPGDGATQWNSSAALQVAGVFGNAAPAAGRGTVVAGFSSGELNAYRYENGRLVWQDALSRTRISTSVSALADIDADPVIDGDQVFALGQGGRMVALDIRTGQRLWELSIAGASTPYVVGDWVFAVTDTAQLLAIARDTGRIRWINQLPAYRNEEKKRDRYYYAGPVLAGGRLFLAGSNGALIQIDPDSGAFIGQSQLPGGTSLQPVVAGETLYILTDEGQLVAYR